LAVPLAREPKRTALSISGKLDLISGLYFHARRGDGQTLLFQIILHGLPGKLESVLKALNEPLLFKLIELGLRKELCQLRASQAKAAEALFPPDILHEIHLSIKALPLLFRAVMRLSCPILHRLPNVQGHDRWL